MLYEITHIRQSDRSYVKRWFTDRDMDLFVWFRKSIPVRFQLAYNKSDNEKAINWNLHTGFNHYLVDDGETLPDRYKQTPMLIGPGDQQNITTIARDFLAACDAIDAGLADFIYARLLEVPTKPVKHNAVHTDHRL